MSTKDSNYRRQLFQKILFPSSCQFLTSAHLNQCSNVVDLGCGEGALTLWMCRQVGTKGVVTAIDKNVQSLRRLEKKAKLENINNLHLIEGEAEAALKKLRGIDLCYSRFFLLYVANPVDVLAMISSSLNKSGIALLEEPVLSVTNEFPPCGFWKPGIKAYEKLCALSDVRPNYGCHLISDVKKSNLSIQSAQQLQPIIDPGLAKEYFEYALKAHKEEYLHLGVLKDSEFCSMIETIQNYPVQAMEYCGFHGVMQVICKKKLQKGNEF